MADIDSIISGASGNTRADFSGLFSGPVDAFNAGRDQKFKNELRDAFKDGVPTLPDGSIDYGTMQRTLYQKGALEQGNALSGISARAGELAALNGADGQPQAAPTVGPSTSRNSVTIDPSKRADAGQPAVAPQPRPQAPQGQPAPQATVMTVLAAQGIPNSELQKASESVARQLGVDPTAPLDLNDPQVRNVLAPAVAQIKRMGLGQVQPQAAPQAPQPAATPAPLQPTPVQMAAQNDPVLKRLTLLAASQDKQIAAAAKVRLESYLKNQELTTDQKNAKAAGQSLTDYQNRTDENTTQREILTKSLLPKVDKSQESAAAARDDIDAIHRSREQLDQNGGVFSGAFADKKLALAKVANALGITDAEKITNTEGYGAAIGQRVAVMVKAFGSGTAISDGDRKFAANMAGGQITLNETSMRRILDIGERAARGKIDSHNKLVDEVVGSNEGLKGAKKSYVVNAPGQYKKPEAAAAPAIKEGDTAFNPKTKERIKYQGGKWVPFA